MNTGSLSVLNVGRGDLEISFSKDDPADVERAKRVIADMLARGYSLFIRDEADAKKLHKVKAFDPEKECYVIVADAGPVYDPQTADDAIESDGKPLRGKRGAYRRMKSVSMKGAKAVGIAPTAGG